MSLGQQQGKGRCPKPPAKEEELWVGSRREAAPGWRADGTWGQGKAFRLLARGKMVSQKNKVAVGSCSTSTVSFLSKMPLPSYSFFGGLALELPRLSLLELGGPLAWCGGTSGSISSIEVGGWGLTHGWAGCGRHAPLSDPSACRRTARTDTTLLISSGYPQSADRTMENRIEIGLKIMALKIKIVMHTK